MPDDRYSRGAIAFHWGIALLIVVNLALGLFHGDLPRTWSVMPFHKSLGITVLALSVARLGWRLTHRPPAPVASMSRWERVAAGSVHLLLYGLMIVMPLTGWAMSSTGDPPRPLMWFGLFPIPHLPVSAALGDFGHGAHTVLGYIMAVLVAGHVAAALRHHFVLRDRTLIRMLPSGPDPIR